MDNYYGLRDYRLEVSSQGLRGLAAVKGNVDKLFADRMKKKGMSWTKEDGNRMASLISSRHLGRLDTTKKPSIDKLVPTLASTRHMAEEEEYEVEDGGIWLQASMPALYGPHSDRPWVQMLRALTRGDNEGVTRAGHPKSQPTNS